jgi:hypothetical protein
LSGDQRRRDSSHGTHSGDLQSTPHDWIRRPAPKRAQGNKGRRGAWKGATAGAAIALPVPVIILADEVDEGAAARMLESMRFSDGIGIPESFEL